MTFSVRSKLTLLGEMYATTAFNLAIFTNCVFLLFRFLFHLTLIDPFQQSRQAWDSCIVCDPNDQFSANWLDSSSEPTL